MQIQNVALLAFLGSFFLLILFLALASYVLAAIGLYTMAKNRDIENAWIAWIPVVQLYIIGRLIGTLYIGSYEVPQPELVLPGLAVAGSVLSNVRLIGGLIGIVSLVSQSLCPPQAVHHLPAEPGYPLPGAQHPAALHGAGVPVHHAERRTGVCGLAGDGAARYPSGELLIFRLNQNVRPPWHIR
jgi:hypothetical protein